MKSKGIKWNALYGISLTLGLQLSASQRNCSKVVIIFPVVTFCGILYSLIFSGLFINYHQMTYSAFYAIVSYSIDAIAVIGILRWIRNPRNYLINHIDWSAARDNVMLITLFPLSLVTIQRVNDLCGMVIQTFQRKSTDATILETIYIICVIVPCIIGYILVAKGIFGVSKQLRSLIHQSDLMNDLANVITASRDIINIVENTNASLSRLVGGLHCAYFVQSVLGISTLVFAETFTTAFIKTAIEHSLKFILLTALISAGETMEGDLARFRKKVRYFQIGYIHRERQLEVFLLQLKHVAIQDGFGSTLSWKSASNFFSLCWTFTVLLYQTVEHIHHQMHLNKPHEHR